MSRIVRFSEAVSIGLHAMVLIARSDAGLNVLAISEATGASKHHVAKIMQRLVKEGFLGSSRGPKGGFFLGKAPEKISLLEIVEAIDGEIPVDKCPMDKRICPFDQCIMNNLINEMTLKMRSFLGEQTLLDYARDEKKSLPG